MKVPLTDAILSTALMLAERTSTERSVRPFDSRGGMLDLSDR